LSNRVISVTSFSEPDAGPAEVRPRASASASQPDPTSAEASDARIAALGQLLLDGGIGALSDRERRVVETIARHRHVTRNVNRAIDAGQTFGDRLADRVAGFGGSWSFILIFLGLLVAWVALNTLMLSRLGSTFDAYPFIFLNLILSMVAAFQAPIILMSQNRQAARDRIAAALDYEVNLKAELEIMALHDKLDGLRIQHLQDLVEKQGVDIRELLERSVGGAAGSVALRPGAPAL
jgi:uncharacterized membrane protein